MVQDSGKKRAIGKKRQYKRQIHILKKKGGSLETQKRKQRVEQCSKEKLIQSQIVYVNLKKKLRNEAGQQGGIRRNDRHSQSRKDPLPFDLQVL